MWRFASRLPACSPDSIVTLGEGDTPLIDLSQAFAAEVPVASLVAKAEDRNPTGSFKARIASVAYSLVRDRGLRGTVGTSSGNGGAAAAAYAAAAGSRAVLFVLSDTVPVKMREIAVFGATVSRVQGVGHDASSTREVADRLAEVCIAKDFLPMLTAFHYSPDAMQGVKTIAYELAEQSPELTAVYVPVGGGGLLTGLHLGYSEMAAEGVVRMPRLIGVQPVGGAALARAMDGHPEGLDGPLATSISGLQMATLYDTDGAVQAVRSSCGHVVTVTDEDIWATQAELAGRRGVLVEPAGATAMAGLLADARAGKLTANDRVAVVLSGAGYKDAAALQRLAGDVTVPHIPLAELPERLAAAIEVKS